MVILKEGCQRGSNVLKIEEALDKTYSKRGDKYERIGIRDKDSQGPQSDVEATRLLQRCNAKYSNRSDKLS